MKKTLMAYAVCGLLISAAAVVGSQTLDDARLAHNATSCEALNLPITCTDVQVAAAWDTANPRVTRPIERQVFATVATYRDNVLLPPLVKARIAARRATFADKVYNAIMTDNAKCAIIATSLGVDTAVCK